MRTQIDRYKMGMQVCANSMLRAHGLERRPELNGVLCTAKSAMEPTGRVSVAFLPVDCGGGESVAPEISELSTLKVRATNLVDALPTLDEALYFIEDQARRAANHGYAAEAAAMWINICCLDPSRDRWREQLDAVPPSPVFMDSLFEQLSATTVGQAAPTGTTSAFMSGLDTAFCVRQVQCGQEAAQRGQQAYFDFANARQDAGVAIAKAATSNSSMIDFFKAMGFATDILVAARLLPSRLPLSGKLCAALPSAGR